MKWRPSIRGSSTCRTGFTLAEVMVSMAIVLLAMAAILSCHLFGLRMFEITKAKLGASDDARGSISRMIGEIRSAKLIRIGQGNASSFTEVALNTPQSGSAIQVYPGTNSNTFVRYFWDASDQKLKRLTNGAAQASVVAHAISNATVFTSENYRGVLLTNNENNRVIGLNLQFYQLQYPTVAIGPGNYYDYYQLRTKITRRALE
jgi:prepilin-type N-terminal cleavage/methylation domain-containing protein